MVTGAEVIPMIGEAEHDRHGFSDYLENTNE
jgi:hypothetical protein